MPKEIGLTNEDLNILKRTLKCLESYREKLCTHIEISDDDSQITFRIDNALNCSSKCDKVCQEIEVIKKILSL